MCGLNLYPIIVQVRIPITLLYFSIVEERSRRYETLFDDNRLQAIYHKNGVGNLPGYSRERFPIIKETDK